MITIEESVDIKRIVTIIKNNKWVLVGAVIFSIGIMALYLNFFAVPIYQSSTQILVSQTEGTETSMQLQNVQTNIDLVDTYNIIIKSPRILEGVSKELQNQYSEAELSKAIKVSNAANSQIIDISVEHSDPKAALAIANMTAIVFQREIASIMKVNNVTILSEAKSNEVAQPIKPKKEMMMFFSTLAGVIGGLGFILVQSLLDRTIKNKEEIQMIFGLKLLGSVSEMDEKKANKNRR